MARLLARILAVLALWLPLASHGLGLGEITLRSALNQPLEAEIALLALRPDETDSVTVKLASNATFEQSGVERTPLHSELRFKLQQKATGDYYIRAYTQPPVKEPFVNFLVEINWSAGRLVREYTVLLDPPTLMAAPAPRIQTPRTQSSSSTAARPIASPAAAVEPERITRAQTSPAALPDDSFTRPRDTLWSLAQRLRPDSSISVQQMMLALLKANPDAFFEHNINSLKAGHHLRVPDLAEINTLSAQEATHEVKQQNAAWSNSRSQPTASAPTGPSSTARLKLLAAKSDTTAETVTAKTGSDPLENLGQDLSLTHETVEAKQQENEDLRSRLSELESQMEAMQKLLALKDQNLANLQNKLEAIQPDAAAEPAQPTTPINAKELQTVSAATPEPPEDGGFDIEKILHGLQDKFQSSLTLQVVAGGSALLLLSLLWLIYRRRYVNAATITTTDIYDLHSPATGTLRAKTVADEFLDDIETDAPEIKTVARNSLAEVDVYLAYEQYPQAEVLLKQLIEAEPKRHELKLRLLELFYLTKNKTAFAIAAENLHTTLAGTGPLWKKAVDMGHSLYPEHPLFSHTTAPETPAADTIDPVVMAAPEVETPVDTDFTLDIPEIESPSPPSAPEYLPLDFEPPLQFSETTSDAAEISLEMANDESSHVDLAQDIETASDKPALEPEVPMADEAPAPLEFRPDNRSPETPSTTPAAKPVPGNNELIFDLEDEAIAMAESDMTTQFDEGEAETEEDSAQDNSGDEVATKLDLARAYLDMGDEEGATSIIAEVLEEGNAAQKQEARDLMSNLTR